MEQVWIAVVGALGIVVPTLLSTRLGKWRILHLIQEESKAHAALPENLKLQRASLSQCIARSVRDYEDRGSYPRSESLWVVAVTGLWVSWVVLALSLNILSDAPLFDRETWEPAIKSAVTVTAISAAILAIVCIVGLLMMVLNVLVNFGPTRKLAIWALTPLMTSAPGKRFRTWVRKRAAHAGAPIPEE